MRQMRVTLTLGEIEAFVFRLAPLEFVQLADEMRERAQELEKEGPKAIDALVGWASGQAHRGYS